MTRFLFQKSYTTITFSAFQFLGIPKTLEDSVLVSCGIDPASEMLARGWWKHHHLQCDPVFGTGMEWQVVLGEEPMLFRDAR